MRVGLPRRGPPHEQADLTWATLAGRYARAASRGPRWASLVSLFRKELEIALYFYLRASFV